MPEWARLGSLPPQTGALCNSAKIQHLALKRGGPESSDCSSASLDTRAADAVEGVGQVTKGRKGRSPRHGDGIAEVRGADGRDAPQPRGSDRLGFRGDSTC